jgi:HK97 family phage prohead protease
MTTTMERRALDAPPAVAGRKVTGYAARFNTPSELLAENGKRFREVILPGAFTRSLAAPPRGDVLALWNHGADGRPPLARTPGTLRLWEDAEGLAFEFELPASAEDVREAVERRDVRGMSFGFARDARDRWSVRDGVQLREVLDAPLFEISLTARPAYPSTSVEARDLSGLDVPAPGLSPIARARRVLQLAERG